MEVDDVEDAELEDDEVVVDDTVVVEVDEDEVLKVLDVDVEEVVVVIVLEVDVELMVFEVDVDVVLVRDAAEEWELLVDIELVLELVVGDEADTVVVEVLGCVLLLEDLEDGPLLPLLLKLVMLVDVLRVVTAEMLVLVREARLPRLRQCPGPPPELPQLTAWKQAYY
eukprot:3189585-Amphidinium_carterae.1